MTEGVASWRREDALLIRVRLAYGKRRMSPYRSSTRAPNTSIHFGDRRRAVRQIVLGVALLAASVVAVVAWALTGGGIRGSLLLPAVIGLVLLGRARWGVLTLFVDRRALVVRRWPWPHADVSIPLGDLATVQVVPTSLRHEEPDYALVLARADATQVTLRIAPSAAALEDDRARIADFMREHSLLWGGADRKPSTAVRVEPTFAEEDAERGPAEREGKEERAQRKDP